jgi:hypothetical protein
MADRGRFEIGREKEGEPQDQLLFGEIRKTSAHRWGRHRHLPESSRFAAAGCRSDGSSPPAADSSRILHLRSARKVTDLAPAFASAASEPLYSFGEGKFPQVRDAHEPAQSADGSRPKLAIVVMRSTASARIRQAVQDLVCASVSTSGRGSTKSRRCRRKATGYGNGLRKAAGL